MGKERQVVKQGLEELREVAKRDELIGQIVCDYADAVNAGKPVTKADFLAQATPEIREKVRELLDLSEVLLEIGRYWREKTGYRPDGR